MFIKIITIAHTIASALMLLWVKQWWFARKIKQIRISYERTDGIPVEEYVRNAEHLKQLVTETAPSRKPDDQYSFIWCLVGSIVAEHTVGEERELRRGTKHFTGGTKVYCFPPLWSGGYEDIQVIGKGRRSRQLITVIMPSNRITNWRLQKVYKPAVIRLMADNQGWTNSDGDKADIERMLTWLPGAAPREVQPPQEEP